MISLPTAPAEYSQRDQAELRRALQDEDARNQKRNEDIIIVERRLILTAPDGGLWAVTVDNSGNLGTTSL